MRKIERRQRGPHRQQPAGVRGRYTARDTTQGGQPNGGIRVGSRSPSNPSGRKPSRALFNLLPSEPRAVDRRVRVHIPFRHTQGISITGQVYHISTWLNKRCTSRIFSFTKPLSPNLLPRPPPTLRIVRSKSETLPDVTHFTTLSRAKEGVAPIGQREDGVVAGHYQGEVKGPNFTLHRFEYHRCNAQSG